MNKRYFAAIFVLSLSIITTSCEKETVDSIETEEFSNKYEHVDLGLPSGLQWATYNVGASSPEKYGGYYAWGETRVKDSYTYDTYELWDYYTDSEKDILDFVGKDTLDFVNDVAHIKWDKNWRIPTIEEWQELYVNCTWTWTKKNGVNGFSVKSKTNGNSIFLPAGNRKTARGESYQTSPNGYYWSSTINDDNRYCARGLSFSFSNIITNSSGYRAEGRNVRPVYVE